MLVTPAQLEDFANRRSSGYLKLHKAHSMIATMGEIEMTGERRLNYLRNCLQMEGFVERDIVLIDQLFEYGFLVMDVIPDDD